MTPRNFKRLLTATCLAVAFAAYAVAAFAQAGTEGTLIVTALDTSGAVIPNAELTLRAVSTNDTRTAITGQDGSRTFVNLAIGAYSLTISRKGYATKKYDRVVIQAAQTTTIAATLPVGQATQTVTVSSEAVPVIDTSSNAIGTVIDVKQIEDLPLSGRDITSFATLVPGFSGGSGQGTYNGLPLVDQGNNIDGMASSTSRMKFGGNIQPNVSPRLEDIEQMTVQTDQLDLNSGFGTATTQLNFVSRRGTNQFHGKLFEDFRNSYLNANGWVSDATNTPKARLILNDFGGAIGGPALHDRLFFFGSFATSRRPGGYPTSNNLFTQAAQAGNFTDSTGRTVNVLTVAANAGLPSTVNSEIASELAKINSAASSGSVSPTSDPNLNQLNWNNANPDITYYPAVRVDYDATSKARFYLSYLETKDSQPGSNASDFPGSFSNETAGNLNKNYTASFGFNYIISPSIINQLTAGYLYDATEFAYNAAPIYASQPTVFWNYSNNGSGTMSGQTYQLPIDTYYPILNFDDAVTMEKGRHTFMFGASWYHEQDHYWNAPGGFYQYNLGLANGDPALNALSPSALGMNPTDAGNAQQLYAILTGRLSGVNGENSYNIKSGTYSPTGTLSEYPLDEVASAYGFFGEDSWKVKPNLTLNFGLRWDYYGPEKDLTGQYHSADETAIYGPTAVGDLFKPGTLSGDMNPVISVHDQPYKPWHVTPQPAFGFAWNPKGLLGNALGNGETVIRGGFALRRYTEPYQYFWDYGTDYGQFYYQQFNLTANNSGTPGTFQPGSLALGDNLPAAALQPTTYQATAPESEFTFVAPNGPGVNGISPNLKQPYAESWNFGIQRMIGHNLAVEVRYNGNHTVHQWIAIDPNEVNVFENGFLKDFQNAQKNLAASPNGNSSFSSSYGNPTPILDAALGGPTNPDYTNGQYINYLQTGQVGAFANILSGLGNQDYLCNLVGASFTPCATNLGYTGAGAGYPINFWQANPYAAQNGFSSSGELVSDGYSNYHGLQVDLRQGSWHGLQYDANYTWSHSLGMSTTNSWTGSFNAFTLRNLRESYAPTINDQRHVFHGNGTYDLPFGKGRQFPIANRAVDEVAGGWTIGTVASWQTGAPFQTFGGYSTFNDYADGGLVLNGVTASQLQKSVGVYHTGRSFVDEINPKYLTSPTGGGANSQYITPNTTAGTIGQILYLHGPRQFFQDMSLSKSFPIHEAFHFRLQGEFLNVWNHPAFGLPSSVYVTHSGFSHGTPTTDYDGIGARQVELRANFEF